VAGDDSHNGSDKGKRNHVTIPDIRLTIANVLVVGEGEEEEGNIVGPFLSPLIEFNNRYLIYVPRQFKGA